MQMVSNAALAQLFKAIEEMNRGALANAVAKLEAVPSLTWRDWVRGRQPKVKEERLWTSATRGGRTPIGLIIESRWLAGLELIAPLSDQSKPCCQKGSSSQMTPAMLCVALSWTEGLAMTIGDASEKAQMEALRAVCEKGDAVSARVILEKAPPAPAEPMASLGACENRPHLASPLHAAVRGRSADCVRALLEKGAEPGIFSKDGFIAPIHMEVGREEPDWEIVRLLLDAMEEKINLDGEASWPLNEKGQTPLMEIMSRPSRIAGALGFNSSSGEGADILLRMARKSSTTAKDKNGNGWLDWTRRDDSFPESVNFKKRLWEEFGLPSGMDAADSEGPDSLGRAIEKCLSEAASISIAMGSMTAAIDKLAELLGPGDAQEREPQERAQAFEALARSRSIIDKAQAVRGKLVELGAKAPAHLDRSASQALGAPRRIS